MAYGSHASNLGAALAVRFAAAAGDVPAFIVDQRFAGGDGIVKDGIENTISSVSKLGRDGMRETDKEILKIMIGADPETKEPLAENR